MTKPATSTATQVGGVSFSSYVFNAAGPKDVTFDELATIAASASSGIVIKTCTVDPRAGNEEPRYCDVPLGSINSMGLPNLGLAAYLAMLPRLRRITEKPIIASVAGMKPDDFPVLFRAFLASEVDSIELNFSCPNLKGKPQIGYDFEMTERLLTELFSLRPNKPIGIKLPPYFDPAHWEAASTIFARFPIAYLTCINSVGNTLIIDPEKETPLIKPKGGFGGLGGAYIKPVALANVRAFSQLLGDRMSIVGVGGIQTGMDAFEFLLCGADAVQVGTQFMQEGPECFARIDRELGEILQRKGYRDIAAARGKLKVL